MGGRKCPPFEASPYLDHVSARNELPLILPPVGLPLQSQSKNPTTHPAASRSAQYEAQRACHYSSTSFGHPVLQMVQAKLTQHK